VQGVNRREGWAGGAALAAVECFLDPIGVSGQAQLAEDLQASFR
jgi:hypothetical protein